MSFSVPHLMRPAAALIRPAGRASRALLFGQHSTAPPDRPARRFRRNRRSEEHTSELQSRLHLVCRLLLEKKNVRLIGVDTPETKHPSKPVEDFSKEASAFTLRLAEGKRVTLDYDQANNHLGRKDQYVRT